MDKSVGIILRDYMNLVDMSAERLAEAIGVGTRTVNRWLADKARPRRANLLQCREPLELAQRELDKLLCAAGYRPKYATNRDEGTGDAGADSVGQPPFDVHAFSDKELAQAREDYLAMLRKEHQYLDLSGLAPRVQNRTVKIKLEDIFIPLTARPEVTRRTYPPAETPFGTVYPDVIIELDDGKVAAIDFKSTNLSESEQIELVRSTLAKTGRVAKVFPAPRPEGRWRSLAEGETLDIPDLLALRQAVVLGDPGSGKSTLLKYLVYAVATQKVDLVGTHALDSLPILIKVVDWVRASRGSESLKSYLCKTDDPVRCALLEQAIAQGKALILLDALDEVPDLHSRAQAMEGVRRLIADCPGNTVLLTSRIVGYDRAKLAGHFEHATLEKLPEEEIGRFVSNWYTAIEREAEGTEEQFQAAYKRAEGLQEAIKAKPGVQALAENPLLLTVIALVNWRGRKLPDRRVELYQHATETLIDSWPFTQRGVRLDTRIVMDILEPVAYRIFAERGSEELDETILQPLLVQAIEEKRGCSAQEAVNQVDELLPQITEQSGIFVERGVDPTGKRYFGFLHQTFAEYFAARHLATRWRAGAIDLHPYARNPRWREVLLLMAGHLGLSDEQATTRLTAALLNLPDEYPALKRNLLVAAECLADDTPVQAKAGQYVVRQLAALACTGLGGLRHAPLPLLRQLAGTAYSPVLVGYLVEQSRNKDAIVRRSVAAALGSVGSKDERVVAPLLELSRDEHGDVRRSAASALGLLGSGDEHVITRLLELGKDKEHEVQVWAAFALGRVGREDQRVIEHLLELIRDEDADTRRWAAWSLSRMKSIEKPMVEHLLELSRERDAALRLWVAYVLGNVGGRDERVVTRLLELSWDENAGVRGWAATALSRVGKIDEHVVERLLELSREADAGVRGGAAIALGSVGSTDERAVARLLELSRDGDTSVQHYAVSALSNVGGKDERVVTRLLELSRDGDAEIRCLAAYALGQVGGRDERVTARLMELIQDEDVSVRRWAADALVSVGSADTSVMARLLELAPEADSSLRIATAKIAGTHRNERALKFLLGWIDDTSPTLVIDETTGRAAYEACLSILADAAPEPPASFKEPPQQVPGPWDE